MNFPKGAMLIALLVASPFACVASLLIAERNAEARRATGQYAKFAVEQMAVRATARIDPSYNSKMERTFYWKDKLGKSLPLCVGRFWSVEHTGNKGASVHQMPIKGQRLGCTDFFQIRTLSEFDALEWEAKPSCQPVFATEGGPEVNLIAIVGLTEIGKIPELDRPIPTLEERSALWRYYAEGSYHAEAGFEKFGFDYVTVRPAGEEDCGEFGIHFFEVTVRDLKALRQKVPVPLK